MITKGEYTTYPPSVLIVGDSTRHGLKLKRGLENKGCRAYWSDTSPDSLRKARQEYFELIVLDNERSDVDVFEVCQKLKTDPELADIPVVMLSPRKYAEDAVNKSSVGLVYFLANDISAEARLWQIIEQVHYMNYRYT
jgi:CheY-like chemotaxis protein